MKGHIQLAFIINGTGGSGKDTFVNLVSTKSLARKPRFRVRNISSVDPIRAFVHDILGPTFHKDDKIRAWMSDMKAAWVKYDANGPVNYCMQMISQSPQVDDNTCSVYFIHIREPEEIQKMKDALIKKGIFAWTILIKGRVSPDTYTNSSDRDVENYDYDFVIDNQSDIDNLDHEADRLVNGIRGIIIEFRTTSAVKECQVSDDEIAIDTDTVATAVALSLIKTREDADSYLALREKIHQFYSI